MNPLPRDIVVRWMSFAKEGEQIVALRRQTHEGLAHIDAAFRTRQDEVGFHLGAFADGQLISVLSGYLFENVTEPLQSLGLPKASRVLELTKFAESSAYRETRIAELLVLSMLRMTYEVLRPQYVFALVDGVSEAIEGTRWPNLGWKVNGKVRTRWGEGTVLIIPANKMERSYCRARTISEPLWEQLEKFPQSLVHYLDKNDRMDLTARGILMSENLHSIATMSLKDELPRLSAQTRLIFAEQKPRLSVVDFPKPPARLLDVGSGPGVYLAALGKTEKLQGYELIGIDASKEMVMYAKLNRADIKWQHANAYETKQPDESVDVVHLNFVMIHLMSPALALREFNRILKPGGLLYIVDVNDSTFRGPPLMTELIEAYHEWTVGDRNVLNVLPRIAPEWGFQLRHQFSTAIRNSGSSPDPEFLPDELRLDYIKMWALYSFIGQIDEFASKMQAAHDDYFGSMERCEVCLQTHVYQKAT